MFSKLSRFVSTFCFLLITNSALAQSGETGRSANIHFGPIHAIAGLVYGGVDIRLSDSSWTLGPLLVVGRLQLADEAGVERARASYLGGGLQGVYYFGRPAITQGWYLSPSIWVMNIEVKQDIGGSSWKGEGTGTVLSGIAGYQWIWESFNIKFGGGLQAGGVGEVKVTSPDGQQTRSTDTSQFGGLALEFAFGWAF